ncbi:MAG: hypothetical protein A2X64_08145 [Ignavibacteria bacterium GWF2_33_9]|nr:MAG: hypothetical protein A2X64_08145 [Ignavibacteria bacterium GWF2_33_9]
MKKIFLLFILNILIQNFTFASDEINANEAFRKANNAYMKEDFKGAALLYQDIIKNGFVSANVYYNLGNCQFRLKNYGKAILNFEKAKRLAPSDESINLNLKIANLKIVDKIKPLPEFFLFSYLNGIAKSHETDTFSWWGILFIWIAVIFVGFLIVSNKAFLKKVSFGFVLLFFLIAASSFYLAYQSNHFLKETNEGIILTPSVYVKSSPDSEALDAFILHEGTKFMIIDNLGHWTKIKIANGNIGWIDKETFQEI